ncbi:MAG: class I SAM-dependent methyltransferase [Candidatus Omnitrophica bacterium]|nr:class I SAM-dependent methyltransferase [Candidatus Omnitrophota bacterium]
MNIILWKGRCRRFLHFVFVLLTLREFRYIYFLFRNRGLGVLSSLVENVYLFRCAAFGYGEGAIVEIGSFKGKTTVSLAYGSKLNRREKVWAVDPQRDPAVKEVFLKNITSARMEDHIIPVFKTSEEAVKDFSGPIRLLFIDGCHEYEFVKRDIMLWKDRLIDGGIIALHDYLPKDAPQFLLGVYQAAQECVINSDEFIVEGGIDSVLFASKRCSRNGAIFTRVERMEKCRRFLKTLLDKTWLKY